MKHRRTGKRYFRATSKRNDRLTISCAIVLSQCWRLIFAAANTHHFHKPDNELVAFSSSSDDGLATWWLRVKSIGSLYNSSRGPEVANSLQKCFCERVKLWSWAWRRYGSLGLASDYHRSDRWIVTTQYQHIRVLSQHVVVLFSFPAAKAAAGVVISNDDFEDADNGQRWIDELCELVPEKETSE